MSTPADQVEEPQVEEPTDPPPESDEDALVGEEIELDDVSIGGLLDDDEPPAGDSPPVEPTGDETPPEEPPPAVETPIDAPQHWPEQDRAAFAELPRDRQEFLLNRHKAMESDYTRKTQEIAKDRERLAGLKPFGDALERDPEFREHVKNYKQPQPTVDEGPEDPIERIKWEAVQAAKKEIRKELKAERATEEQQYHQTVIDNTVVEYKKDPQYHEVMTEMAREANAAPTKLQPKIWQLLESDPEYYREMFAAAKARLFPETPPPKKNDLPPARSETVHKPKLQGSGTETHKSAEKTRKQQLATIRKRMDSGSVEAIGDYFDAIGQ